MPVSNGSRGTEAEDELSIEEVAIPFKKEGLDLLRQRDPKQVEAIVEVVVKALEAEVSVVFRMSTKEE